VTLDTSTRNVASPPVGSVGPAAETSFSRPLRTNDVVRILAVCETGPLEDRLRRAARALGQDIRFVRSFPDTIDAVREHLDEIVIIGKLRNGMPAREFMRQLVRVHPDVVVVVAAAAARLEDVIEVMLEGAFDFLPDAADDGQLRLMLGRAIGHSQLQRRSGELKRALDAQATSMRQRLSELALLNQMAEDLAAVPELDAILDRALCRVLDAFGCECGSFLILDTGRNELVVRAAAGRNASALLGRRVPLGEGISGRVAADGHPVLVNDVSRDSRFRDLAGDADSVRGYSSGSFVAVPLIHHGRLLGELNVTERCTGEAFDADDLRLLATLAGHVANAVNGALAAEELRRSNASLEAQMTATERSLRSTSARLTQAESIAHAVVSSLPAAVAAFDADLTINYANDAARDLLGLAPGDSLRGQPAWQHRARLGHAAVAVCEQGSTHRLRLTASAPSAAGGGCLSVVVAPFREANGAISGGTIVATAGNCPLVGSDPAALRAVSGE
jgi:GAF domain-containing protein